MENARLIETVKDKKLVYDGSVVHLEKWTVELPDGRMAPREIVMHVGAAAVVPVDKQGNITLVRQYRVAVGRVMLEVPAGKLDRKDEDPLLAAQRELHEETGLIAENWTLLSSVITTPGFCDEKIALYLATELTQRHTHFDEDEFLNIETYPAQEVYRMVYAGEIHDVKSIAALLLAKPHIDGILLDAGQV